MYRNPPNTLEHVNFVCTDGGLGDAIARLPVINYVLKEHPHIVPHLWVPDFFKDFAIRSINNKKCIVRGFSEKNKYVERTSKGPATCPGYTNLSDHMTDHAFRVFCGTSVDNNWKNYLKPVNNDIKLDKFNLPKQYVVVTTGFTTAVREFLPQYINEVVKYIKGKGYEVVFLGKKQSEAGHFIIKGTFKEEIDFATGIDLIDKTSLIEAQKICSQAKFVLGLDNGLLHVAATSDVPIIGSFTTVKPEHRMPYRNDILGWNYYPVVPPESLKCRFCQSKMVFQFDNEFDKCFYKDLACTKQVTPELYINEINKII